MVGKGEIATKFKKKLSKIYLVLYSSGKYRHPITNEITEYMATNKYMQRYEAYLFHDPVGTCDGVLEACLKIKNIRLLNFIIEKFVTAHKVEV